MHILSWLERDLRVLTFLLVLACVLEAVTQD